MIVDNPKPAPWLKTDCLYRWKLGKKCQIRYEFHSHRLYLIPNVWIDWEQGMFTIAATILQFMVGLDFEFDPEYDASQEETEYPG